MTLRQAEQYEWLQGKAWSAVGFSKVSRQHMHELDGELVQPIAR